MVTECQPARTALTWPCGSTPSLTSNHVPAQISLYNVEEDGKFDPHLSSGDDMLPTMSTVRATARPLSSMCALGSPTQPLFNLSLRVRLST